MAPTPCADSAPFPGRCLAPLALALALALLHPLAASAAPRSPAKPTPGAVATVHPRATQAGLDALDRGGNAIDAAVAASIFLRPDGEPWAAGERVSQPDLAATYRALARHGTRWFYRGPFARRTEAWMKQQGGLLTRSDFARYRPRFREPIRTRYRDCEIVGFPPPSSGGVHVAQILNILDRFDLPTASREPAGLPHLLAEAMKLAFADRARWLGDPDFVPVPRGLVSTAYAAELAGRIDPRAAAPSVEPGTPPGAGTDLFGKHTTHLATADATGIWVALTATINTTLGSKVVIPGTGVVLNNQMDDFVAQPGATNFFGLVGTAANAVEPGKRPLSSMSPTLVLRNGQPVFSAGAAGGPTIISQTLLAVVQTVDFGRPPAEALAQPRLHHQWRPDEIVLEQGWPAGTAAELRRRGHVVREVRSLGAAQAIGTDGGRLVPAADPRVQGSAGTLP